MDITGKKNLQKGEAVIYYPELHWIFLVKPILILVVALVLLLTEETSSGYIGSVGFFDPVNTVYKIILIVIFILALLYLFRAIIEFFFVQYSITNKRLSLKKGLFTSTLIDMPIEKVESIICVQSIFGHLFNYGTVFVSGIGGRLPRYSTIRKPLKVRRILYDMIDKNKQITVIREDLAKPVFVKEGKKTKKTPEIQYGTFVTSYPAGERQIVVNK